jgi:hypothetical protein
MVSALRPGSINRCSAALDKFSSVTQRSQSLALGLTLTAAPQLVGGFAEGALR